MRESSRIIWGASDCPAQGASDCPAQSSVSVPTSGSGTEVGSRVGGGGGVGVGKIGV